MAKKIEEGEVKKECPSCGLGVALDSKICEFCGWDFEEEDEWILQIEKLERELMLEKQKFEPGSVEQKIEATLYTPEQSRAEPMRAPPQEPPSAPRTRPTQKPVRKVAGAPAPVPQAQPSAPQPSRKQDATPVSETIEIENARIRTVRGAPELELEQKELPVRKVRAAKPAPAQAAPPSKAPAAVEGAKTKKVRVVRKVKG